MDLHSKQTFSLLISVTVVLFVTQRTSATGCAAEELGVRVPSLKRIPDKYMTSSSDQSSSYQAFRGRIGLESRGSWGNSWCASESDSDPYIQIFFQLLTNIEVIETEGVVIDGGEIWVKSYEVSTSNDSKTWTTYSDGSVTRLQANTDVEAKNVTLKGIWTHFIRIHPQSRHGKWRCIRLALYGCQTGTDGPIMHIYNDVLEDAPNTGTPLKETFFLVIPIVLFGCVILIGLFCLCCRHRPKRAHQIKERQEKREKERKYYEEKSNPLYDNVLVYDQPPPYEFQTVALNFDHDDKVDGGQIEPSETPVFIEDNKIFSFERNAIAYT